MICTLTALVILCSGCRLVMAQQQERSLPSAVLPVHTETGFPSLQQLPCAASHFPLCIGWGLYGARCAEFLFKEKAIRPFMVLYSLVAIIGATVDLGLLWSIAETFNGLMAIPNLIAVFLLSGVVVKLVKEYFAGEGKNA